MPRENLKEFYNDAVLCSTSLFEPFSLISYPILFLKNLNLILAVLSSELEGGQSSILF